ncbi:MAG: DUF721 domain-containing protein [bacterium]|nr:DUF721 domain-containing protein [bacterium]MCY4258195.1 DUF721 domain-containing protein [bacterium]
MTWEPLKDFSEPQPIVEILEDLTSNLHVPGVQVLQAVFDSWDDLVGSAIASHSTPVWLREGELVVEVDDPVWAAEVRFFSAELMSRINAISTAESVEVVRVRVRPIA